MTVNSIDNSNTKRWSHIPFLSDDSTSISLTSAQLAAFKAGLIPDDKDSELHRIFENPRLLNIDHGQIISLFQGVYFRSGRFLDLGMGWSQGYKWLKTKLLIEHKSPKNLTVSGRVKRLRGNYLCLNVKYGCEFYHAIFDLAYQIFVYETQSGMSLQSLDGVIVPSGFEGKPWVVSIIEGLLPCNTRVIEAPHHGSIEEILECENLIAISWSRALLPAFRRYLLDRFKISLEHIPNASTICVRRKNTTNVNSRLLLQEKDVHHIFKQNGFAVCDMAEMNFLDQVKYATGNTILASVHGAALSHSLFLPMGAAVVEILGPRHVNNAFYHISCGLNLDYFPIFDRRLDVEAAFSDTFRDGEIDLDLEALESQLEWIVNYVSFKQTRL